MEGLQELLDLTILQTADQRIALWQIILLPVAVLLGYFVSVRVIRLIKSRLLARAPTRTPSSCSREPCTCS